MSIGVGASRQALRLSQLLTEFCRDLSQCLTPDVRMHSRPSDFCGNAHVRALNILADAFRQEEDVGKRIDCIQIDGKIDFMALPYAMTKRSWSPNPVPIFSDLTRLSLNLCNPLRENGGAIPALAAIVPNFLAGMPKLHYLHLTFPDLAPDGSTLPNTLESLYGNAGLEGFVTARLHLPRLYHLQLDNVNMTRPAGVSALKAFLGAHAATLSNFTIRQMSMPGPQWEPFFQWLGQNLTLEKFDINNPFVKGLHRVGEEYWVSDETWNSIAENVSWSGS